MAESESHQRQHAAAGINGRNKPAVAHPTGSCLKCGCKLPGRAQSKNETAICAACAKGLVGAGTIEVAPLEVAPIDLSQKHRAPCPKCGAATTIGVPECSVCGHAPSVVPGIVKLPRPKRRASRLAAKITCKTCSYDLTGLKAVVCPECGTSFSHYTRAQEDEELSREIAKKEYSRAAIMMASGLLVIFLVAAITGRWNTLVSYGILFVLSVAITYGVSLACFFTFMGLGSSLPLMALQVAGVHAVCLGTLAAVNTIGMLGFVWSIGVIIMYVYMMSEMLDLDPSDARIIAVLSIAGLAVCSVVLGGLGIL